MFGDGAGGDGVDGGAVDVEAGEGCFCGGREGAGGEDGVEDGLDVGGLGEGSYYGVLDEICVSRKEVIW